MNIQIASDWHFEFHADQGTKFLLDLDQTDVDVLVMAGDMLVARFLQQTEAILTAVSKKYPHVLFVPGNHEFYETDPQEAWNLLKAIQTRLPNLHVMHDEAVTINKQRFLGGTMWFPPTYDHSAEELMNDFWTIRNFKPWVFKEHEHFLKFIEQVKTSDIVITHHLPSFKSIPSRFSHSALNPFFAVELDAFIMRKKPKLWIHGHTHTPMDYRIGQTRVICNPLGYPHEGSKDYNEHLVIDCDTIL